MKNTIGSDLFDSGKSIKLVASGKVEKLTRNGLTSRNSMKSSDATTPRLDQKTDWTTRLGLELFGLREEFPN